MSTCGCPIVWDVPELFTSIIPSLIMEEEFAILLEYKKEERARKELEVKRKLEEEKEKSNRGEAVEEEELQQRKCLHNDQVLHEGSYVCTACGLVLVSDFQPEVNWSDRCVLTSSYTGTDRLQAVDKHLTWFLEKTGLEVRLHPVQERLRFMKKECGYRSLSYPLALMCILEDHPEYQERLQPFLPKSHVAWARSSRLLKPLPVHFRKSWLRRLIQSPKPLSKAQLKRLHRSVALFRDDERVMMHDMILLYGSPTNSLDSLPYDLKYALYKFSSAILKSR